MENIIKNLKKIPLFLFKHTFGFVICVTISAMLGSNFMGHFNANILCQTIVYCLFIILFATSIIKFKGVNLIKCTSAFAIILVVYNLYSTITIHENFVVLSLLVSIVLTSVFLFSLNNYLKKNWHIIETFKDVKARFNLSYEQSGIYRWSLLLFAGTILTNFMLYNVVQNNQVLSLYFLNEYISFGFKIVLMKAFIFTSILILGLMMYLIISNHDAVDCSEVESVKVNK